MSICRQLVFGMVYSKAEKPENVFIKFEDYEKQGYTDYKQWKIQCAL